MINTLKAIMHLGEQFSASCKKRVVSHITYCDILLCTISVIILNSKGTKAH